MIVCDDVLHWAETYEGPPFHALLSDPPYHLISDTRNGSLRNPGTGPFGRLHISTKGFMGSTWDGGDTTYRPETWEALARHLLPGAFVMAFASSRGYHRLACAMEDAGLIIHPSIFGWGFGSGWPKATRIDTQVDADAGAQREIIGQGKYASRNPRPSGNTGKTLSDDTSIRPAGAPLTTPVTPLAQTWAGHRYGRQMLKPALEPIIVAQKPYAGRPVDSITQTGAGALWIEGGRVKGPEPHHNYGRTSGETSFCGQSTMPFDTPVSGRWPSNLALLHLPTCERLGVREVRGDPRGECTGTRPGGFGNVGADSGSAEPNARVYGTETVPAYRCADNCPVRAFDLQAGERSSGAFAGFRNGMGYQGGKGNAIDTPYEANTGSASRFFYTADWALEVAEQLAHADPVRYEAKSSRAERDAGLTGRNTHPTLKPLSLCTWLASLLLPPAAYAPRRLLVPFCGTASEMVGGMRAGWESVLGIEQEEAYVRIGRRRLAWWTGYASKETNETEHREPGGSPGVSGGQLTLF